MLVCGVRARGARSERFVVTRRVRPYAVRCSLCASPGCAGLRGYAMALLVCRPPARTRRHRSLGPHDDSSRPAAARDIGTTRIFRIYPLAGSWSCKNNVPY